MRVGVWEWGHQGSGVTRVVLCGGMNLQLADLIPGGQKSSKIFKTDLSRAQQGRAEGAGQSCGPLRIELIEFK